jgi:hypothetical protein
MGSGSILSLRAGRAGGGMGELRPLRVFAAGAECFAAGAECFAAGAGISR